MTTREELEAMPIDQLHDRTMKVARHRLDVGFLWDLVKALPVAEEVVGDDQRSKVDIARPLALINDFFDAGEGELGEALRPMYVDYLSSTTPTGTDRRLSASSSPTGTSSRSLRARRYLISASLGPVSNRSRVRSTATWTPGRPRAPPTTCGWRTSSRTWPR